MTLPLTLPPLAPLEIPDTNTVDKWKKFNRAWINYSLAMELNKKSEVIQIATLLMVIGEDALEVFPHLLLVGTVMVTIPRYS